jgi:hypothetical protein
MSRKFWRRLV